MQDIIFGGTPSNHYLSLPLDSSIKERPLYAVPAISRETYLMSFTSPLLHITFWFKHTSLLSMAGTRPPLKSWFCIKPFDKERAGCMLPNEEWGLEIKVEGFV